MKYFVTGLTVMVRGRKQETGFISLKLKLVWTQSGFSAPGAALLLSDWNSLKKKRQEILVSGGVLLDIFMTPYCEFETYVMCKAWKEIKNIFCRGLRINRKI